MLFKLAGSDISPNRWVKTIVFGLSLALLSSIYAGWAQFSLMLYKKGVYQWLCSSDELVPHPSLDGVLTCPAMQRGIERMLFMILAAELASSFPAGMSFDKFGPRITCGIGIALMSVSYIALIVANSSFLMISFCVFNGFSINFLSYPALCLKDYFPENPSLAVSYTIAAQMLSTLIPIVLWNLWQLNPGWTYEQIWTVYFTVFMCLPSLVYILSLPSAGREQDESVAEAASEEYWKDLAKSIMSPKFVRVCVLSLCALLLGNYWAVSALTEFGYSVNNFLGIFTPTEALWGLLAGYAADRFSSTIVSVFMFACFTATYAISTVGMHKIQYLSAVLFVLGQSYAFSYKFNYIQENFSAKLYGMLAGICGTISGLGMFLINLIQLLDNYQKILILFVVMGCVCTVISMKTSIQKAVLYLNLVKTANRNEERPKSLGTV